jgi:hypothetical protein
MLFDSESHSLGQLAKVRFVMLPHVKIRKSEMLVSPSALASEAHNSDKQCEQAEQCSNDIDAQHLAERERKCCPLHTKTP